MNTSRNRSSRRGGSRSWLLAGLVSVSMVAAACGDDEESSPDTTSAATTPAPETTEGAETTAPPDTTGTETTETPDTTPDSPTAIFPSLGPPTGEEIILGMVNTEGTPGLDFPEIREAVQAAVEYLNQHGGLGNRPIKLETCQAKGSPETSQACAQELAGKNVEMVLLGLDLFPDYATYTAANIPVIGVLPILPGDYTANALFLTGGNATTTAAMAAVAKNHFGASTVAIVSADNPGANGTQASLVAALDLAGIAHTTVKGGDNETDAGYQGLMREAAKDNPDVLISLYADDGCIGTMRGRAALGITIPVITTSICSGRSVIDVVGDDALGWMFIGVQTQEDTPELAILQDIVAPWLEIEPDEVDTTALGLGNLGLIGIMTLATFGQIMDGRGDAVTGTSLFEFLGSEPGQSNWPTGTPIECGANDKYPTICSFIFPVGEYTESGEVLTVEGLEAVSAKDFLP